MPPKRPRGGKAPSNKTGSTEAAAPPASEGAKRVDNQPSSAVEPATAAVEPPAASAPDVSRAGNASPNTTRLGSLNSPISGVSSARGGRKLLSQPKVAGRRSLAKREEIQKAENDKRQQGRDVGTKNDARETRREARKPDRGRGSGSRARGRGRGGYIGESDRVPVASGPFSAGQVDRASRGKTRGGGATRGARGGGNAWASEATGANVPGGAAGVGEPSSSTKQQRPAKNAAGSKLSTLNASVTEDGSVVKLEAGMSRDAKPLLDGDGDIYMDMVAGVGATKEGGYISSDEDEDDKELQRVNVEDLGAIDLTKDEDAEYDAFAPVRVQRIAHKERALGVNADAVTSDRKKGKQRSKDVELVGSTQNFQAVYSSDDDADAHMKPDPNPQYQDTRVASPEPDAAGDADPHEPPSSPESKRKAKERIKARALSNDLATSAVMPDFQTPEEGDEWKRHQNDLRILRRELGGLEASTESEVVGTAESTQDRRRDKVYLFQFPPVLPDLVTVNVKPDPDATNGMNDLSEPMDVDAPSNKKNPVTIADDQEGEIGSSRPKLPSGAVGKMRVHASGRVTLDWGGTSLCLGMGAETSFLQDVLVTKMPSAGQDGQGGSGEVGTVTSMGQVKGKFVVTPNWDDLL